MKDYGYILKEVKVGRVELLNLIEKRVNETGRCAFAISRSDFTYTFETQLIFYVKRDAEGKNKFGIYSAYREIYISEEPVNKEDIFKAAIKLYEEDYEEAFELSDEGTQEEDETWKCKSLEDRQALCLLDVFSEYETDTLDESNVIEKAVILHESGEKDEKTDGISEDTAGDYWYIIEVPTKEAQERIFAVAL